MSEERERVPPSPPPPPAPPPEDPKQKVMLEYEERSNDPVVKK